MALRILNVEPAETPAPRPKQRGQPPPKSEPARAPEPPPEKPPRLAAELASERARLEAARGEVTAALARERERARDTALPAAAMLAARRESLALADVLQSIERGLIELQIDELRTRRADIEARVAAANAAAIRHDPARTRERRQLIDGLLANMSQDLTDDDIARGAAAFAEYMRAKRDADRLTVAATGLQSAYALRDEIDGLRKRLGKMEGSTNGTN